MLSGSTTRGQGRQVASGAVRPAPSIKGLSAADVLTAWERGGRRNNGGRALALLAAACPQFDADALAGLAVGRRDAFLLDARALTLGPELVATARCPACSETLEFIAQTSDLRLPEDTLASEGEGTPYHWSRPGSQVTFRLPTAADLVAIGDLPTPAEAERALLARCVLTADLDGAAVSGAALPADIATEVAAAMVARDPQAEILLNLACPACGQSWQAPFDIAGFFWAEIAAYARRLLREVDTLARVYGWHEADILALSASRRQAYIEMIQG